MGFAEELYNLRKKSGISQKELAQKIGVSQASINYWEKSQRTPSIDMVTLIADYFGVTLDSFIAEYSADTPNDVSEDKPVSFPALEMKVEEIGYRIIYGTYQNSDGVNLTLGDIFIKYPDGKQIFMTPSELENLNEDTDSYLKFKLEELRKKKEK